MIKYFTLIIVVLLLSCNLYSQEEWKLSGQVQLRTELDGRDFSNQTHPLTFASLRTRVGLERTFSQRVNFFAQLQDSRVFGEEVSVTSNSANVDLHQGYVKLINLFDWNWSVQAGRFVVSYGTERFLGASEWSYTGRAWDGVRFSFEPGFNLDLFGLTQREPVGYIGSATPGIYPYPDQPSQSRSLYGFFAGFPVSPLSKLEILGYYDVNRTVNSTSDDIALKRFNLSGSFYGTFNQFSTVIEGGYQFGKQFGEDITAYLVSLQGTFDFNPIKVGAGVDILSGTNSPSGINTYSVQYGTNHKFYGFMDYFTGNPTTGLNDIYFMAFLTPEASKFSGSLYIHHFMSNKDISFVSFPSGTINTYNTYGQEIDLTVKYAFIQGTSLTWGGSIFVPGDIMKSLYSGNNYTREDAGFWTYLMITANL